MGIDLVIECRAKTGHSPPSPSWGVEGEMREGGDADIGSTHALHSMTRYYGRCYERGPWPSISAYLLELMADPQVEAVWYGGDSDDHRETVTLEWLTEMNLHYIDNGERPYRENVPAVRREVRVEIRNHSS